MLGSMLIQHCLMVDIKKEARACITLALLPIPFVVSVFFFDLDLLISLHISTTYNYLPTAMAQHQTYQQPAAPPNMQYQSNPSNQQLNEKHNHSGTFGSRWNFGFASTPFL